MIFLFTDFGVAGPYVGQMKGAIATLAPGLPVIDLMHDAPAFDPRRAAYLLAAAVAPLPIDAILVCVVDPGVGGDRPPVVAEADGRRFVGPGNGLFEIVLRRAASGRQRRIAWRPDSLSASFHGRDLFAPAAARLAVGDPLDLGGGDETSARRPDWPDDLAEIAYVDGYGNAMTGVRTAQLPPGAVLQVGGQRLARARTFDDRPAGTAFWYGNSLGLAEIAVTRGSAAATLSLEVGSRFAIDSGGPGA